MKELRILGLRSLKDTGSIRIAPITVLVGENSSGKSTFLRTMPLLKQTVEVRTSEPLLWFGRLVDFGSFEESVSNTNTDKAIEFEISLDIDAGFSYVQQRVNFSEKLSRVECKVRFKIVTGSVERLNPNSPKITSFVESLTLDVCNTRISAKFSSPSKLSSLFIDGVDFTELTNQSFAIGSSYAPTPTFVSINDVNEIDDDSTVETTVHNLVKRLVHGRVNAASIFELTTQFQLDTPAKMLEAIKNGQINRGLWKKEVLEWTEGNRSFIEFRRLIWISRLENIFDHLAQSIRFQALSIAYITPLRAAAERYYRQQGLATNELDAKGENFALFLRSLNNRERESLRKWLGSALGVYVDLDESVGHVSLYLVDEKTKSRVNLADTGFGYSQLLPIAIQLWLTQTRKRLLYGVTRFNSSSSTLVVIEQPELHLHPRVQAKVADLLAHATSSKNDGFEARVIVETHSEALVNRLGKLVANGTLQPSDVNVVLFNKPNFSEPTVVTTTSFDSNGFLQDWPLGFFNSD
jgi:predicted ATPase